MFCKQCGKPTEGNQEICNECLANQNTQNNNNAQTTYTQNPQNNAQFNSEAKSKMAAGLLGIFLGGLGIHNFYLGYTGKALAQLLISLLSCGMLAWASAIWGLIEGVMLLTGSINVDGKGNPLKD